MFSGIPPYLPPKPFLSISFMICFCHIFFFLWLSSTCGTSPETVQPMEYSLLPWGHLDAFSTGVTWTAVISHHHIFIFESFVALPTLPFFWGFFPEIVSRISFWPVIWHWLKCCSSKFPFITQLSITRRYESWMNLIWLFYGWKFCLRLTGLCKKMAHLAVSSLSLV